ncbi:hypothetical protein C8J57DRAFT_1535567 [Mycena rebaudengoi]|nr:hypothetical protein C8J57DRAFT_1535567 [Mycena rebaudengoi]
MAPVNATTQHSMSTNLLPTVDAAVVAKGPETTEATVNHNGPTCAHCGWRGGGHASNCPFK